MYQQMLSTRYSDFPPPDSQYEKFGMLYEELGYETALYLRSVELTTEDDERAFYQRFRSLYGAPALCCVVQGRPYIAFDKTDFNEFVPKYLSLSEEQKVKDCALYFQFHGLDQNILFQTLEADIELWKEENCHTLDDCFLGLHIPDEPYPYQVFYNIGHIEGFDGVQLCDDGGEIEGGEIVRLRAGEDDGNNDEDGDVVMEAEPNIEGDPVLDPRPVEMEVSFAEGSSHAVRANSVLTPIAQVPDEVRQWALEVKTELFYQKTVAGVSIATAAWEYAAPSRICSRYGKTFPESALEHFILGRLLNEQELDAPVPAEIKDKYPQVKDMTVKSGLDYMHDLGRRHLQFLAKQRRIEKHGSKVRILTRSGARIAGVKFKPGETLFPPEGEDPGSTE